MPVLGGDVRAPRIEYAKIAAETGLQGFMFDAVRAVIFLPALGAGPIDALGMLDPDVHALSGDVKLYFFITMVYLITGKLRFEACMG